MTDPNRLTAISRKMSFLLRHCTAPQLIDPDGGWAKVSSVIDVLREKYRETDLPLIERIVAEDEKGRYSFNPDHTMIRANQGHSIPGVVIEMECPEPPDFLYHGTAERFLGSIMSEGLKPMNRAYVHISSDYDTALKVGSRHGKPAVLKIRARDFVNAGHKLCISPNGVWQAEYVPPEFFTLM